MGMSSQLLSQCLSSSGLQIQSVMGITFPQTPKGRDVNEGDKFHFNYKFESKQLRIKVSRSVKSVSALIYPGLFEDWKSNKRNGGTHEQRLWHQRLV